MGRWICCTSCHSSAMLSASPCSDPRSASVGASPRARRPLRCLSRPRDPRCRAGGGLGEIGEAGEYVSFIALISALYITAGGIHISGNPRGTPQINTTFLAIGAVAASVIGTTGASMLLIRPLLDANRERKHEDAHRRLLHSHRLEHRRPAHAARRPAAVSRLPERRAVLVHPALLPAWLLAQSAAADGFFVWDWRMLRPRVGRGPAARRPRTGRRRGSTASQRRPPLGSSPSPRRHAAPWREMLFAA